MTDREHRGVVHRAQVEAGDVGVLIGGAQHRAVERERRVDHSRVEKVSFGLAPHVRVELVVDRAGQAGALLGEPYRVRPRRRAGSLGHSPQVVGAHDLQLARDARSGAGCPPS